MYSNQKEYIQSVEIHRDGLYSPWGFRLKGGIDVDGGIPLEIVKVRQIWSGHKNVLIHSNKMSWSGHFSTYLAWLPVYYYQNLLILDLLLCVQMVLICY